MSRAARIWWLALGLLAGLWWDGQRWTYPGGWSDERARQRHPRRWPRPVRCWPHPIVAWINKPPDDTTAQEELLFLQAA